MKELRHESLVLVFTQNPLLVKTQKYNDNAIQYIEKHLCEVRRNIHCPLQRQLISTLERLHDFMLFLKIIQDIERLINSSNMDCMNYQKNILILHIKKRMYIHILVHAINPVI